jgi:hypothetical protein
LPDLTIQDVRIRRHKLTIRFWRQRGKTHFQVIDGDARVVERRKWKFEALPTAAAPLRIGPS